MEITFANAKGETQTVAVTADVARALLQELADFAHSASGSGPVATKMPKTFAVGTGKFEDVVLVRFEQDAPYGLVAEDALELGRALVAHGRAIEAEPQQVMQ